MNKSYAQIIRENLLSADSKSVRHQNNHLIVATNLSIITQIFYLMKDSRIDQEMFFAFLYDEKLSSVKKSDKKDDKEDDQVVLTPESVKKMTNAYRRYETFIHHTEGSIDAISKKLISYGISKEYFNDTASEFLDGDETVIDFFAKYIDNNQNAKTKIGIVQCRECLLERIFSIKNKDGSLVIDCVRNIMLDILNIDEIDNPLYVFTNQIVNAVPDKNLSRRDYKKYYNSILKDTYITQPRELPDFPNSNYSSRVGNPLDKNKASYEWYKIQMSLFIIREAYLVFAEMDDIPNALDMFYEELGISENEYMDMLFDSEVIDNKRLANILTKYKYPASIFHAEHPSRIKLCPELNDFLDDYYGTDGYCIRDMLDDEDLHDRFRFYLLYRLSADNYEITFATMSLIAAIYG